MYNRVGLGTYPLSISSKISKHDACAIVGKFLSLGGHYIDTAPLYGFGDAEVILGEVLNKFKREDYFIASKCGYVVESQSVKKSSRYQDVIKECDNSLKRLNLDYLDLYFTHFPDRKTSFSETMSALSKLQTQGKIKKIGVSNVNLEQLKEYNKEGKVSYLQNRFSLLSPIEKDFEKYLLENRVGLVPYHVIERGLITEKVYSHDASLRSGVLQVARADWNFDDAARLVKCRYAEVARNLGITIEELAIAWVLNQPFVSFALVGTTNPDHLKLDLAANNIKLPTV